MADIFESPDGGHTVYVRRDGSSERTLYHVSIERQAQIAEMQKFELWGRIHRAASNDPALQDMIKRTETYFHLKYSP